MRLARRVLFSSAVVAIVATSPAAAMGNQTDRPVNGTRTATTTLNPISGAASTTSSGRLAHLGRYTGQATVQFFPTSATTFGFAGTATFTAANGDKLFGTFSGSGAATSATTSTSTNTFTITGGTGRFNGASGSLTETINSTLVSLSPTSQVFHDTTSARGTITY